MAKRTFPTATLAFALSTFGACGTPRPSTGEASASEGGEPPACASYVERLDCQNAPGPFADPGSEVGGGPGCAWVVGQLVTRTADACTYVARGACVRGDYGDTNAGCGVLSECAEAQSPFSLPYYEQQEDGLLLMDFCEGTPPSRFTPCESAEAASADPPECACACGLWPLP